MLNRIKSLARLCKIFTKCNERLQVELSSHTHWGDNCERKSSVKQTKQQTHQLTNIHNENIIYMHIYPSTCKCMVLVKFMAHTRLVFWLLSYIPTRMHSRHYPAPKVYYPTVPENQDGLCCICRVNVLLKKVESHIIGQKLLLII